MKNKTVLITGASSGIGRALAMRLGGLNHELILTGRRRERLIELKQELTARGLGHEKIHIASFDVKNRDQIEKFVEENKPALSKIDVLVNNAGLAKGVEKVSSAKLDDWDEMIATNISGLFYITRKVLDFMTIKKSGHIVNLGSVAGRWVYPGGAVYCSTKFAVRAFSEGLRQDLLGTNIRVTNIEPGMVNTEFSTVRLGSKEKADAVYKGMTPLSAEDIAETIQWVIDRPQHVNVQELVVYPTDQASVGLVNRV